MEHIGIIRDECTGCGVCISICPKKAVTFGKDTLGRRIPVVDAQKCVECGLCTKRCHALQLPDFHQPQHCYAAIAKNDNTYFSTSSGGIATVLAETILAKKGCVYGAAFVPQDLVKHIRVDNREDLSLLKGSKYVISKTDGIFDTVFRDLKEDKWVLFIGTPCQISALHTFLPKPFEKLITVDLICHGTPPHSYFSQHVLGVVKSNDIQSVSFRVKEWFLCIKDKKGQELYKKPSNEDTYFYAFLKGIIFRDNCYRCKYAQRNRCSDITLGDFWGIKNTQLPDKYKSLVLTNTECGEALWLEISSAVMYEEHPIDEAVAGNEQLNAPSKRPIEREAFEKAVCEVGFESAMARIGVLKACRNNRNNRLYHEIILRAKRAIKRMIGKV